MLRENGRAHEAAVQARIEEQAEVARRARTIEELCRGFDGQASASLAAVGQATARLMASAGVNTVAGAAEQLSSSIAEISRQMSQSTAISAVIREMDGITAGIAAAVEQQGAATSEIARNVQEVAMAANQISASITDVSASVDQASEVAGDVRTVAEAMSTEADVLKGDVAGFLGNIREA